MRVSSMGTSVTINKKRAAFFSAVLLGLMLAALSLIPVLREMRERLFDRYYLFGAVLAVAALVFMFVFEKHALTGRVTWLLPLVFLISVLLLLLFDRPLQMPFWCFGGILLVCAFKLRVGMIINYFLLFLAGSTQEVLTKEAIIMQVFCLALLGFMMPYAKKWKDAVEIIVSVFAVLISIRVLFFFLDRKEIMDNDIFYLALAYLIVVIVTIYFANLLREANFVKEKEATFDYLEELAAGVENQDAELLQELLLEKEQEEAVLEEANLNHEVHDFETEKENIRYETAATAERMLHLDILTNLCSENAPLLEQLRNGNKNAYLHARRVALLASEIAERLEGVEPVLVKAGGYYHEIGRLLGKNTMGNTLMLAEREEFPTELCEVLREHSVNGDKPTTKEAALVLLTDNICSMCEYLKKNQSGRLLIEKVIDKSLNLRLSKGDLNNSGLSVKEFSVIRNSMAELMKEDMF